MERVILTTGGTGGHIFPALAVAEELKARFTGIDLLFVGSKHGPEAALCARAALPFRGLPVKGFRGRGFRAVGAIPGMLRGFGQALFLLRAFKPDAVIGFGGYAAFALVLTACLLGIPAAIHEQNALAGVSNRILAKTARKILCSFPDTRGFEGRETVLTGNPVRGDVIAVGRRAVRGSGKRLLVMGGSRGAEALNRLVTNALPRFKEVGIELRHQTGEADFAKVRAAYAAAGMEGTVEAFIHDMGKAYAWADLALCRAGATTIAELAACGLPAFFVPFPYATHDHQSKNADLVVRRGGAVAVAEAELAERDAPGMITALLAQPEKIADMARAAARHARPQAAAAVADELAALARASRG
jgi:UDP-N-acetylglucosamine--N-acetylmuramyl-(pentapeptide) pyrophosphoryl-undecaprenol N-acetylglucosamine transferase